MVILLFIFFFHIPKAIPIFIFCYSYTLSFWYMRILKACENARQSLVESVGFFCGQRGEGEA